MTRRDSGGSNGAELPRRNAAGHAIWFRASSTEGGVYRPVTRQGCAVMLAAVAMVLVCGIAMVVAIVVWQRPAALLVGFGPLAIGLVWVAHTVLRRS